MVFSFQPKTPLQFQQINQKNIYINIYMCVNQRTSRWVEELAKE